MLYKETLDLIRPIAAEAINELFYIAFKNQVHAQDLLIVIENGSYKPDMLNFKPTPLLPYVIGPAEEGFCEQTMYDFYHSYRTKVYPRQETHERLNKKDKEVIEMEEMTIQLELMIYQKFWETDLILKRLYQLTQLALGKQYEWEFSINNFSSRQALIREKVRDELKTVCPKMYSFIKSIYRSQLRNAAAHTQYSFHPMSRIMHFTNTEPRTQPLRVLSFDDWEQYIHGVIMLYNEMIRAKNEYGSIYAATAQKAGGKLPIFFPGKGEYMYVYDPEFKRWHS